MKNYLLFALLFIWTFSACEKTNSDIKTVPDISSFEEVLEISYHSVKFGGTLISEGSDAVTAVGICWSKEENADLSKSKIKVQNYELGKPFSCLIENLLPGMTYYIRAYAVNSVGTSYGKEYEFTTLATKLPTVETDASVTDITTTGARIGANVIHAGGDTVTSRGFCWNTDPSPTIENNILEDKDSGLGIFSATLTGLTSGKTYYVRSYATNKIGTAYGNEISFMTGAILPTVITSENISNITETSARCGGEVTEAGSFFLTERGLCLATHEDPTTEDDKRLVQPAGIGKFTVNITGILPNTTYYVRAFATSQAGTSYGKQITFSTPNVELPSVNSKIVLNYVKVAAVCAGQIMNLDKCGVLKEYGLCLIQGTEEPTINDVKVPAKSISEKGEFGSFFNGLKASTKYTVRAYAINALGTVYGPTRSFTTTKGGNMTYTINKVENPDADQLDAYKQIKIAMDSCCYYYNNYCNYDKFIWANYDPGVPTADANSEGWMRFGKNRWYMWVGTAMHEAAHTLGVGTTSKWSGLLDNGVYKGTSSRVLQVLRVMSNNQSALLYGDGQHFWPGGINQRSDVKNENDLIMNAMILNAMKADGL